MAKWGFILAVFATFVILGCESSSKFDELFKPSWAFDHFAYDNAGEVIDMKLDNYSGMHVVSRSLHLVKFWLFSLINVGFGRILVMKELDLRRRTSTCSGKLLFRSSLWRETLLELSPLSM